MSDSGSTHLSSQELESIFFCKIDNSRIISNLLDTINFGKNQVATITIYKHRIKFTVEEARSLQANVFLQQEIFQEFVLKEDTVTFRVHLQLLVECLNIFGTSPNSCSSLQMMYAGYGEPLFLM
jgi:cell cycle checkpoint protein